jgi:hypothetical protein
MHGELCLLELQNSTADRRGEGRSCTSVLREYVKTGEFWAAGACGGRAFVRGRDASSGGKSRGGCGEVAAILERIWPHQ